jgi:hypothetical protein
MIHLADHTSAGGHRIGLGRDFFGVLSMFHETKVAKPGVGNSLYAPCLLLTAILMLSEFGAGIQLRPSPS